LREACKFCEAPENRPAVARWLFESGHFTCDAAALRRSLVGPFDDGVGHKRDAEHFHIFHERNANQPTRERAAWLLQEFKTSGLLPMERWEEAGEELRHAWAELPAASPAPAPVSQRPARRCISKSTTTAIV
jgi:NitT/TauT family transport system ATP-binding protein